MTQRNLRRTGPSPRGHAERDACSGFRNRKNWCGEVCQGFICTRMGVHGGEHVAAGGPDIVVARWAGYAELTYVPKADPGVSAINPVTKALGWYLRPRRR